MFYLMFREAQLARPKSNSEVQHLFTQGRIAEVFNKWFSTQKWAITQLQSHGSAAILFCGSDLHGLINSQI